MKKCIKCNFENDDTATVCSSCGSQLTTAQSTKIDMNSFFTTPLVMAEESKEQPSVSNIEQVFTVAPTTPVVETPTPAESIAPVSVEQPSVETTTPVDNSTSVVNPTTPIVEPSTPIVKPATPIVEPAAPVVNPAPAEMPQAPIQQATEGLQPTPVLPISPTSPTVKEKKPLDKKKIGIIGGIVAAVVVIAVVCVLVIPSLFQPGGLFGGETKYYETNEFFFIKSEAKAGDTKDKYALFDVYGNQYSDFIYSYYENENSFSWDDDIDIDTSKNYIKALIKSDDDTETYEYYSLDGKVIEYDTEKYKFEDIYIVNNKKAIVLLDSDNNQVLKMNNKMYDTSAYDSIVYNGSIFIVTNNDKIALFDSNFEKLTDFVYTSYQSCTNKNLIQLEKEKKYVIYDTVNNKELLKSDEKIVELYSDSLDNDNSELFVTTTDNDEFVYDETGKALIENVSYVDEYTEIKNVKLIKAFKDSEKHLYDLTGKDLGEISTDSGNMVYYHDGKVENIKADVGNVGENYAIFASKVYEEGSTSYCHSATYTVYKNGIQYTAGEISADFTGSRCDVEVSDVYEVGDDIYYGVSIGKGSYYYSYTQKMLFYKNKDAMETSGDEFLDEDAESFYGIVLVDGEEYILYDSKYYLYDKTGNKKYVISHEFDDGSKIIYDYTKYYDSEASFYLIDSNGKNVNSTPYEEILNVFVEDMFVAQETSKDKYKIFNTKGELIGSNYTKFYKGFGWFNYDTMDDIFLALNTDEEEVIINNKGKEIFKSKEFKDDEEVFDNHYIYSGEDGVYSVYDINNEEELKIDVSKTNYKNSEAKLSYSSFSFGSKYYTVEAYYSTDSDSIKKIYYYSYHTHKNFYTETINENETDETTTVKSNTEV